MKMFDKIAKVKTEIWIMFHAETTEERMKLYLLLMLLVFIALNIYELSIVYDLITNPTFWCECNGTKDNFSVVFITSDTTL